MINRNDVINAYRLILGREPENEQIVLSQLENHKNIEHLRQAFLDSEEFRGRMPKRAAAEETGPAALRVGRHYDAEPITVQLDGPSAQLRQMLERVTRTWRNLGETEPHWSVLSDPQFHSSNIEATRRSFYDSGFANVASLKSFFARNSIGCDPSLSVLELGCGVGRISAALAKSFKNVIGLDISSAHLRLAKEHCSKNKIDNAEFILLDDIENMKSIPKSDIFLSLIVLQHSPPPIIKRILEASLEKINNGGFAFFQVPTYARKYSFDWDDYLARPEGGIEMHVLPQPEVFRILDASGFRVIEVQEDAWTGAPEFVSQTFFAQRVGMQ